MNGIFNYQVPGQKAQLNNIQNGNAGVGANDKSRFSGRSYSPFKPEALQQIKSLVQLFTQLFGSQPNNDQTGGGKNTETGSQKGHPTRPDFGTTQALGEEEGGANAPNNPAQITTFAIGEEDGGNFPPASGGVTAALGEEGGGPPTQQPNPPQLTTFAIGEEDGGS